MTHRWARLPPRSGSSGVLGGGVGAKGVEQMRGCYVHEGTRERVVQMRQGMTHLVAAAGRKQNAGVAFFQQAWFFMTPCVTMIIIAASSSDAVQSEAEAAAAAVCRMRTCSDQPVALYRHVVRLPSSRAAALQQHILG